MTFTWLNHPVIGQLVFQMEIIKLFQQDNSHVLFLQENFEDTSCPIWKITYSLTIYSTYECMYLIVLSKLETRILNQNVK